MKYSNCEGITRRHALGLGLGGLWGAGTSLSNGLKLQASNNSPLKATAKRCILIWLDGGPTHFETFDPKPEAPTEIRGEYGTCQTKQPGVHYSEHMSKLAAISDKFAMIRSIRHNQGNHGAGNHYMMTGAPPRIPVGCGAYVSFHPSMGSVVSHESGNSDALPNYFSMPRMSRSGGPNFLGANHAPFVVSDDPSGSNFRVRDVAIPGDLSSGQFRSKSLLRSSLDRMKRFSDNAFGDPAISIDEYYEQGLNLVLSPDAQVAFDISQESEGMRDRYYRDSFGQRCLLARRLAEAGVPFVTVYNGGWDHHRDLWNSCRDRLPKVDQSVAALISDLDERGLLDETLVLVLGEFGRTPKINTRVGRDHWSNAMSVLMAGGGTPGGVVVGATDKKGYSAIENVKSPENFVSTVYAKMGIDPGKILYTPQGRPTHVVSDPTPITELMS